MCVCLFGLLKWHKYNKFQLVQRREKMEKTQRHSKDGEDEGVILKTQIINKLHVLNSKLTSQYVYETIKKFWRQCGWLSCYLFLSVLMQEKQNWAVEGWSFLMYQLQVYWAIILILMSRYPLRVCYLPLIDRFRFTTFPQALVSLPWGCAVGLDWLRTSMSWSLSNLVE